MGAELYLEITPANAVLFDGNNTIAVPLDRAEFGTLTQSSRQALLAMITDAARRYKRAGQRIYCALPARGVSLRRLKVPQAGKEEFARVLGLQIESEFPLPPNELAWGYETLPDLSEVLVVAIKKDLVRQYSDILSEARVDSVFTIAALDRLNSCPRSTLNFSELNIGPAQSELITVTNAIPASIRILSWGSENLVPADGTTELENLLQSSSLGEALFLSGPPDLLPALATRLSTPLKISCEPIQTPNMAATPAILGLRKQVNRKGRDLPLALNLQSAPERKAAQPLRWKYAALAAALAMGCFVLRYAEIVIHKPRLQKKLAQVKQIQDKIPALDRQLSFLQYIQTNHPPYLDLVAVIANSAQPGMKVDTLAMSKKGDLVMRGTLQNGQQAVDFRSKLLESGFFSNVVLDEQNPSADGQKLVVRLTGQVKPAAERKPLAIETSPAPNAQQGMAGQPNMDATQTPPMNATRPVPSRPRPTRIAQ